MLIWAWSQRLVDSFSASSMLAVQSGKTVYAKNVPDMHGREFLWTDSDFVKVQGLIYKRAGINLHDGKHAMVYSRLSRRLRETGYTSFNDYLTWLESCDGNEWQEFINALTTNLTSFFREVHHFRVLYDYLRANKLTKTWRIWCSASSTGEEPYSIVMTASEALGAGEKFSVIASDIDSKVLTVASNGIYRIDDLKNVSESQLKYFFLKGKASNNGFLKIKPVFRNLVQFLVINLVNGDWPFKETFDVVFCRNVMIYFDSATQRHVLERIHRVMSPGGLLFVGHAENFSEARDLFILRGKTVYERR